MDNLSVIFFIAAVLIFGGLLFVIMAIVRHDPVRFDVEKFRSRWLTIEQQLKRDEPTSYAMCVMDADKLLDQALIEKGIAGKTMAERMKAVQSKWSHSGSVWAAHKLRNQIAHEADVRVEYDVARRALAAYKQALKDVGAI